QQTGGGPGRSRLQSRHRLRAAQECGPEHRLRHGLLGHLAAHLDRLESVFKEGWLKRVFGDRSTVIRGGYSLVFDRTNTVQTIIVPTLGVGFAQTVNRTGPACNASNAPGPGCVTGAPFRIGVDGPIPLPTAPQQLTSPVI